MNELQIINAVQATDDSPIILDLELGNVLQNPVPGVWESDTITWTADPPNAVLLEPLYNGVNCRVTSKTPGTAVTVEVTAKAGVCRDTQATPKVFTPMEATTEINFSSATNVTCLVALPDGTGPISYKKVA